MEHIAAVLLIVGCSQDMRACVELPAPTPIYETAGECDAELPVALKQLHSAKPRVLGACVFVDPAMEEEDAELVWNVTASGRLVASIESSSAVVASIESRKHHE